MGKSRSMDRSGAEWKLDLEWELKRKLIWKWDESGSGGESGV